MKKIVLAEIIGVILSIIVFAITFRLFVGDLLTALVTTFFALAAVAFVVIFTAHIASLKSTTLPTSLFVFAGPILIAAVIVLAVLTVVVIQLTPVLFLFIIPNTLIVVLAFTIAVFFLADAAAITKKSMAISLLFEAILIITGIIGSFHLV